MICDLKKTAWYSGQTQLGLELQEGGCQRRSPKEDIFPLDIKRTKWQLAPKMVVLRNGSSLCKGTANGLIWPEFCCYVTWDTLFINKTLKGLFDLIKEFQSSLGKFLVGFPGDIFISFYRYLVAEKRRSYNRSQAKLLTVCNCLDESKFWDLPPSLPSFPPSLLPVDILYAK